MVAGRVAVVARHVFVAGGGLLSRSRGTASISWTSLSRARHLFREQMEIDNEKPVSRLEPTRGLGGEEIRRCHCHAVV